MLGIRSTSISILKRTPKLALILLASHSISIVAGYFIRDAVLLNRKEIYTDVLVVDRFDEHSYRLEIAYGRFNAKICPEASLDWQRGQKMKEFVFEQRNGCKSVVGSGLGFRFWTDDKGKRMLFPVKGENTGERSGQQEQEARR
jgi:hypothetical protein